jgi:hypothetical protein
MWAKIESNSVSKIYARPTSLLLNGIRHPANIFSLWSEAELKAIGIYEIVIDNTNRKDSEYYINTNQTYAFASDTVTASYGTATVRAIEDVTNADDSITKGLKSQRKGQINATAAGLLQSTDWMVVRAAEGGTAVPSANTTYRAAVRTKANTHCTAIDGVSDVNALAALVYDWPTAL